MIYRYNYISIDMTEYMPKLDIKPEDVKVVSGAELAADREAITLDADQEVNVANIEQLSENIITLLQYMNQPEMKELKRLHPDEFEKNVEKKYPGFVNNYYSIFKMLISGEDISNLISMMRTLDNVNKGNMTFDNARNKVSTRINDQFVNPKLSKNKKHHKH
jgi:hypothetical protein